VFAIGASCAAFCSASVDFWNSNPAADTVADVEIALINVLREKVIVDMVQPEKQFREV